MDDSHRFTCLMVLCRLPNGAERWSGLTLRKCTERAPEVVGKQYTVSQDPWKAQAWGRKGVEAGTTF